ncbi:hypothetical protein MBLNU230_g1939t1 [Neophaeotheca triangularis]
MAPVSDDDFILTLSDDENGPLEEDEASPPPPPASALNKRKRDTTTATTATQPAKNKGSDKASKKRKIDPAPAAASASAVDGDVDDIDPGFDFQLVDQTAGLEAFDVWGEGSGKGRVGEGGAQADRIDEIVARRGGGGKVGGSGGGEDDGSGFGDESDEEESVGSGAEESGSGDEVDGEEEEDDEAGGEQDGEDEAEAATNGHESPEHSDDDEGDEDEEAEKRKREKAFFAPEDEKSIPKDGVQLSDTTFHAMSLSRPILKGVSSVGFGAPTPIQAKTIPVALLGKDVVGGAVTGSGKTAAFIIPILERLLYRPKKVATTRVAILMPTRELALQCFNVARKLASFTDITFGQAIGGMSSKEQEKQLKTRPDIVIATPGRFIDFMRNSASFAVDTLEILVLDEADRMLEDGFADELNEILTTIPKSRQTMLFSATMTSSVDNLIRVGLQRPVRLMVDAQRQTVSGLVQEFVRLRPGREDKRLGYLMYLCDKIHTERVIIFFRQKKEAHRVRIIFALCGLKAAELHGNVTQEQRYAAIEAFRSGQVSFLLATDVASRGLDIKNVETVLNYEAPQSHEIYLHRVGRTARAGRSGRSCTIAAEPDRKVVKAAVKAAKAQGATIRQRTVDPKDAEAWKARLDKMEPEIEAVMKEEKEEKVMQQTERDLTRADNLVKYQDEIKSRPKKTWFESESDKKAAKQKGAAELNGPLDGAKDKKPKGKLSNKQKKRLQDRDERKAGMEWKKGKSKSERAHGPAKKGGPPPNVGQKGGKKA